MENQKKTINDYLDEGGYFREQTTLVIALLDQDNVYLDKAEEIFSAGTCPPTLPVIELPPEDMKPEKNQVIRWDGEKYYLDYDFRGQIFYKKATGNEVIITELGAPPDTLTDIPYPGQFYIWSEADNNWVVDEAAKAESIRLQNEATKKELSVYAESRISLIQDEIDLEMTNDLAGAEADLKAWKKYRILVDRVDTSTENPEWPRRPDLKE